MQNIQDVSNASRGLKPSGGMSRINNKDAVSASAEYKDVTEKLRGYKLRKKQIEDQVKAELGQQYQKFEALKKDLELDKELLTDLAISTLLKGETVKVTDGEQNDYEPVFKVSFKKVNLVSKN